MRNLTGQKFRTRLVLRRAEHGASRKPRWFVRCTLCGHETTVDESMLLQGAACKKCVGPRAQWAIYERLRAQGLRDDEIDRLRIGAPVTVGQLIQKTDEKTSLPVFVQLVGPNGYATVRIKEVLIEKRRVLLLADLPEVIKPWVKKER